MCVHVCLHEHAYTCTCACTYACTRVYHVYAYVHVRVISMLCTCLCACLYGVFERRHQCARIFRRFDFDREQDAPGILRILGLVLGALGAILGPRYAQPYLENLGPFSHSAPASGRVVEKRLEEDRLLLRVSTDEGLTLAIFTRNLEDVDLLIGQGDSVELGAGRYEPFLHDPAILRVRPAKATIRNDSQRRSADIGSQIGTDDRAGAEPGPRAAGEARMEYEHRMERQLTQLEALIATFERRVTRAGTDIGEATRHELDELNERRGAARAKLKEIKTATAYAWQDLRAGVDEAWENLREALIDAQARFGEGERVPPSTVPTPAPAGPSDGAQDRDPSR